MLGKWLRISSTPYGKCIVTPATCSILHRRACCEDSPAQQKPRKWSELRPSAGPKTWALRQDNTSRPGMWKRLIRQHLPLPLPFRNYRFRYRFHKNTKKTSYDLGWMKLSRKTWLGTCWFGNAQLAIKRIQSAPYLAYNTVLELKSKSIVPKLFHLMHSIRRFS